MNIKSSGQCAFHNSVTREYSPDLVNSSVLINIKESAAVVGYKETNVHRFFMDMFYNPIYLNFHEERDEAMQV